MRGDKAVAVAFCIDFSPWDEVMAIKAGHRVVTLETGVHTQSSFVDPWPQPWKLS